MYTSKLKEIGICRVIMGTKQLEVYNLMNSNNYDEVIEAMDNLQDIDKFIFENFDPKLIQLYSRLETIADTDPYKIIDLIPDTHKFIDKLPHDIRHDILNILNTYEPYVNVYPPIKNPDLNILEQSIELRKKFNKTYERIQYPKTINIQYGKPPVHCSRRHLLAEFFKIDYNRVYVSYLGADPGYKLLQDVFANTLLQKFDIYTNENDGINLYIWAFLNKFRENGLKPIHLLSPIRQLKNYLIEFKLIDEDLTKFLNTIMDALQQPNIEKYLISIGYNLQETKCKRSLITNLCKDRQIEYEYIENVLRPLLTKLEPFEIDMEHSVSIHMFLDAFPYHNNHYCYIKFIDNKEMVQFEIRNMRHNETMKSTTIQKFVSLLELVNLNLSYSFIEDITKTIPFSVDECISLFPYVLDFKNYICAFLASLVCKHFVNIFDNINTKLQYQLIKCLPKMYHINMQTDICRYTPIDPRSISLQKIYQVALNNDHEFDLENYDKFVYTLEYIKRMVENRAHLYLICSQISINEFYIFEYMKRNKQNLDPLTSIILTRLLLGNAQISNSEQNILHELSGSSYIIGSQPIEIGYPEINFTNRTLTQYDTMNIDEYFSRDENTTDIPLIVEEVGLKQLTTYMDMVPFVK